MRSRQGFGGDWSYAMIGSLSAALIDLSAVVGGQQPTGVKCAEEVRGEAPCPEQIAFHDDKYERMTVSVNVGGKGNVTVPLVLNDGPGLTVVSPFPKYIPATPLGRTSEKFVPWPEIPSAPQYAYVDGCPVDVHPAGTANGVLVVPVAQ